jgi:SAM-dependent methyltransferase
MSHIESLLLPKADFEELLKAEENHFWFKYRNNVIGSNVFELLVNCKNSRFLELGCGNGNVIREIEKRLPESTIVGSELHEEGLLNARGRVACELVQADIYSLPNWAKFDLIGIFDVLEHLPDDVKALQEIRQSLKPGGKLIITVPASMKLWSYFDKVAGHFKRYSCDTLEEALLKSGFKIVKNEPFMMPLFPVMWLSRKFTQLKKKLGLNGQKEDRALANDQLKISPFMNFIIGTILGIEGKLINMGVRMPFGTSILAIAENPDNESISLPLAG